MRAQKLVIAFAASLVLLATSLPTVAMAAGPSFSWLSPVSGSSQSGVVKFEGQATSASGSYIKQWCLSVDGSPVTSDASINGNVGVSKQNNLYYWYSSFDSNTGCWNGSSIPSGTFVFDTTKWDDGVYSLEVTVTDSANRSFTSSVLTIQTNNPGPTFTWLSPVSGSSQSGVVKFEGQATPDPSGTSNIKQWCLSVDGSPVTSDASINGNVGVSKQNNLYYWYSSFDSNTGCWNGSSIPSGTFSLDFSQLLADAEEFNTEASSTVQMTVTDSSDRDYLSASLVVTAFHGQLKFATFGNTPTSASSYAPSPVVDAASRTSKAVSVVWDPAPAGTPAATSYLVRTSEDAGLTWTTTEVSSNRIDFTNQRVATSRLIQVAAKNSFGVGPYGAVALATTRGVRTQRITVLDSDGTPVSGGSITWSMTDKSARSSITYGLTADGVIDFPYAPAGFSKVTIQSARLSDGLYVSGTTDVTLGFPTTTIRLPAHANAKQTVVVNLPEGGPRISGVHIAINRSFRRLQDVGDFTFEVRWVGNPNQYDSYNVNGYTDQLGRYAVEGFLGDLGDLTVTADYDDGVITQNVTSNLTSPQTSMELDYLPYVQPDLLTVKGSAGAAIPVTLSVIDPSLLAPARLIAQGIGLSAAGFTPRVKVTLVPPKGAKVGNCGAKNAKSTLTGVSGSDGKVRLKVCGTVSGTYTYKTSGALAAGSIQVLVNKAKPLAVNSVTVASRNPGEISASWNAPTFLGGAKVSYYQVTIKPKAGGKAIVKKLSATQLTLSGFKNASDYTATIVAVTKYGASDPISVDVAVA